MQNVVILQNLPVTGLCGRYLSLCGPEPHAPLTRCIRVYSILVHTEKGVGGRVEPERRKKGDGKQFTNKLKILLNKLKSKLKLGRK